MNCGCKKRRHVYTTTMKLSNSTRISGIVLQQDPMGHYQLGKKNTVYLEMIYVGVRYMYFCAKLFQDQCILGLVFYTKWTVHLETSKI